MYYHKLYQTEQHQSCFQESIWLQVDADLDPVCKATILKATRLQVHCKHPWSFWSLWQEWWIWPHSSHTYTLFGMPYLWTPVTHTPQQQPPQVLTRLIQEMGDVPMQLRCVNAASAAPRTTPRQSSATVFPSVTAASLSNSINMKATVDYLLNKKLHTAYIYKYIKDMLFNTWGILTWKSLGINWVSESSSRGQFLSLPLWLYFSVPEAKSF